MATLPTVQEKEGNWISLEMALLYGVRIPKARMDPDFKLEGLDHFQTRKDYVFIVTYPKSG